MAITQSTRFSIYRWSADTDAFTRTQLDVSHQNIELYAAKMLSGATVPTAAAQYARSIFLNTTNSKLYYYDAEDASGTWRILETAVIQNSLADAKGDMIVASANDTWAKLGVGAQNSILTVTDGSSTVGWAAPAIQTPAGTISATIAATAPSGWLFLEGQTITSAEGTYPNLWSVLPAAWKSGSSLVLPDWRGRYMASYKAADTNFGTLGSTVTGATQIATSHLPTHTHTINHGHTAANTAASDISHTHSIGHGHGHTIGNASADHAHSMSHTHAAATASDNGSHAHEAEGGSGAGYYFVRRVSTYNTTYVSARDTDNNGVVDGTSSTFPIAMDTSNTAAAGVHGHTVPAQPFTGNTGGHSVTHTHAVTITDASGATNSGAMSANATTHVHSFTPTSHTGNSGDGGFANGQFVMPSGVINWMIKAH
jgi:hypothetical protein